VTDEQPSKLKNEDTSDDSDANKRGKDDKSFGVGETIEFDI
jgi:hypothetical protein